MNNLKDCRVLCDFLDFIWLFSKVVGLYLDFFLGYFMAEVTVRSDFGAQENKVSDCFHFLPHLFRSEEHTSELQSQM